MQGVLEAPEGTRFCKDCQAFVPLSQFHPGQVRYSCKLHTWEKSGRAAKKKILQDHYRRKLYRLWALAYADRRIFGQACLRITQADMEALLMSVGASSGDIAECRIVPRVPTDALSLGNAAVVTCQARRCLVKAWKAHGEGAYQALLRGLVGGPGAQSNQPGPDSGG